MLLRLLHTASHQHSHHICTHCPNRHITQVEHPITEAITGQDLVEHMLRVAAGQPLTVSQDQVLHYSGSAMECRVYSENPARGELGPGLKRAHPPGGWATCAVGACVLLHGLLRLVEHCHMQQMWAIARSQCWMLICCTLFWLGLSCRLPAIHRPFAAVS